MAKQFWEDDAPAASSDASPSGNFWEGDAEAAKQDLPKDVKPSSEQGGRGKVNPPILAARLSDEDLQRPAGVLAATIRRGTPPDRRSLVERSVEDSTDGQRALLVRQERRANWEQDQVSPRTPSATGSTRPKDDVAQNRGADFALGMEATGPLSRVVGPVGRVAGKVTSGIAQGIGGVAEAVGDVTGIDTLARAGKATAEGAEAFQKGMGKGNDALGFGPRSPLPYLAEQTEGAASSLGQSAALAASVGSRGVIAAQSILQAGQSYNEARQAGMDPASALARAVPQGAFEALGEKFQGLDKLSGAMGTLLQRGASDAAKRTAADVLVKAGIREVPGEVLTYLGQTGVDLIPGIGLNPNLTMEQFLQGLGDTVVQTAIMGGATAGAGRAAGGRFRRAQPGEAAPMAPAGTTMPPGTPEAAVAQDSPVPGAVSSVPPQAAPGALAAEVTNPAPEAAVSPIPEPVVAATPTPVELAPAPAPPPPGAFARAALAAGAITPEGRPTAMNDPRARPKTFAEQQEAMNAVEQLEAEQDAQADFEAAMLGDESLPPAPPEGAQDAPAPSPAPSAPTSQPAATEAAPAPAPAPEPKAEPAIAPAPAPRVAPAQRSADAVDAAPSGEGDATGRPAEAVDAPPAPRAPDRAEPDADAPSAAARATYPSLAAATAYIRQQRARGTSVAAAPYVTTDGEIVIATKGSPEYEQALDQRQTRLKGESNVSSTSNVQPVAGRSDRGGSSVAGRGVASALGRPDAAGPAAGARAAKPGVQAQPAPLGREPSADALSGDAVARQREIRRVMREQRVGVNKAGQIVDAAAAQAATDSAAHEAATSPANDKPEPTDAQKKAGNYAMGHLSGPSVQGLRLTIENPKDSERRGTSPDGTEWVNKMGAHYGYAKGSEASDGDHVDVFVGPAADRAPTVYLIDQVNADGTYDEAKAMFGFMNKGAALKAYKDSYSKGWKVGPVTPMPVAEFKAGLESGRFKKPVAPEEIVKLRNSAISAQSSTPTVRDSDGKTYPTKGEPLPTTGVSPANLGGNGVVYVGRRNGQHFEIANEFPKSERGDFKSTGFVNADGQYMDREQALAWVEKNEKTIKPADNMEGALDALDYREQVPESKRAGKSGSKAEKPRRELKTDRLKREADEERAKYFAPGNVIRGYGNQFDRVISYQPADADGHWSVTVQRVKKTGPQTFEALAGDQPRTHNTQPSANAIRTGPALFKPKSGEVQLSVSDGLQYPLAEPGSRYEETGDKPVTMMTPDEFLQRVKPLTMDEESRDAIDALKEHIESGRKLDPLHIRADGKEDGRHRAHAAKELGIKQVPVVDEQRVSFSAADPTETPAFKKWFKGSKVVDADGKPLVVYHGTASDFAKFDPKRIGDNFGADDRGFFFTSSPKEASDYAENDTVGVNKREGANVMPAYVALKNPLIITPEFLKDEGMGGLLGKNGSEDTITFWDAYQSLIHEWADERRSDGVIVVDPSFTESNGEPRRLVVAFKPNQIKSATGNRGTFDSRNADINLRTGEGAGPAVKTKPASAEHEAKAARVLSSLQAGMDGHISFQAVEPDDNTDAGKMLAAVRLTAKRLFGHDVVFVRFNGPAIFNGAMSTSAPNTVFVRVDSSKPHMAILGHELLHSLRQQSPGLYAAIEHRLNQLTNDQTTGYYTELKKKYDAIGREAPEGSKLREELYADIVGDHFLDPKFWDGMAADQRGLFRRVADAIVRFLDKVIAKLGASNALGTQELLKDAEEARRVVIAGMRAFSEEARARSGLSPIGTTSLSATTRKPAAATEFTRRSKVKHVVFHATNADFDTFDTSKSDLGAHFGTVEQANKVAASRLFGREGTTNIMPVYIDLRSPLRLKDVGTFHADGIAPQLAAKGWMTKAEAKAMVAAIDRDWTLRPKYDRQVRELIQEHGYDGVVYKNDHEGQGDSYIVFEPSQVKSATGNRGTFDRESDDIRMSANDIPKKANPALTRAIFGGSMEYMRDQNGKPVKAAEQIEKYKKIDTDERGQMLLRQGHVTVDQLKRWKESPLDVYDGAVNNRFRKHFESPGIVWRDDELRDIFKLDDEGVAAYRALRAQADESIARHAVASMLRLAGPDGLAVRDQVLSEPMDVAAMTLRDHLLALADQRRTPAPAPKVQMTEKERADAMTQAVRLEGEAEAMSQKSPDNPTAAAMAKIDEAKALRAKVSASIQAPAKMTPEAKLLMDRANAVVDLLDQANDDMGNGRIPDDMKAEARPNPWESTEPTRLDRFIYELQDGRIDLKRTQEAIEKSGAKIAEKFDARLAETLYSGRMAKRTQAFLEDEGKPLLQVMARQGIGQIELGDYLHARAAPERNAQIAKVNPDMPDGGAGSNSQGLLLTTAAARQYIADIPAERRAKLEALAQRVDGITKGTRALLVAEGLEKADTIAAWEAVYKTYVPMFREDVEFSRITTSKRATGSEKKAVNILANVLLQREAAITRAEKNRIKVAMYGLALSNPNPKFWVTIRPETDRAQMLEDVKSMGVDPVVAEAGMASPPTITTVDPVTNLVVEQLNPFFRNLPTAISLKVNGENRVLLLNEEDPRALRMANAMKGADSLTEFELAGSLIGKTTRWLAAVNTQYNPVFGIVNFMRDTMGGVIHLGNTELRGSGTQVVASLPGAIKGITAHLAGRHDSGKWSKLFEQFQLDGGQTGFREMFADGTRRAEAVERDLKRMAQGRADPRRMARNMMSLLSGFNEVTENAVRLSAYATALDKGISRPEAARLARELTVDFNRKGRATREIGPLYAFFNAAVQGNERTLRALRGPTGRYIIAGGFALGVAQALMLAAAGIDDDEIPDYVKARAMVIPLFNKDKSYILIPLPLGLHVIPNTGRILTEMILGDGKNLGKKAVDAIGEVSGAFNPLGGGNIFTMDGALRTIMPTIIDPLIELGFNKNFAGTQIERDPRGETDVRPGYQRARESTQKRTTGQAYLGISKAMNAATGGTEYEAGAISPTPERIRYVAQVALGGVLRETEKIIDATTAAARGEAPKPGTIPVASRFYGEVDDERTQQSRYFNNKRKVDRLRNAEKAAHKAGNVEGLQRLQANPLHSVLKPAAKIDRSIQELNKLAVQVIGDVEQQKAVDAKRVETMRALNEGVKAIEQATSGPTLGDRLKVVP